MVKDTDYWATPDEVVTGIVRYCYNNKLVSLDEFTIDVCASETNTKVKDNFITEEMDAFKTDWGKGGLAWCNPPYSRGNVGYFLERSLRQLVKFGTETIMLVNGDNSTAWFDYAVREAKAIIYVTRGRINFKDYRDNRIVKGAVKPNIFIVIGKKTRNEKLKSFYLSKNELYELGA